MTATTQPKKAIRGFECSEELWAMVKAEASRRTTPYKRVSASEIVREAVYRFLVDGDVSIPHAKGGDSHFTT